MVPDPHPAVHWKTLFRVPGFPIFFFAMFVSLFGTGMNFAGVTWYVLGVTHSTVKVSLIAILVTLPGLVVPPFGGVLIDRVDRRYLGVTLDAARAVIVLGTAGLAYAGRLTMWELYLMVLLLGVGFAVYWSTTNALVQELVPREQLLAANATILIAVQGGMAAAGALVGFIFERSGLVGILGIDGTTYFISALCLLLLRQGYRGPRDAHAVERAIAPRTEPPPEVKPPDAEPSDALRASVTQETSTAPAALPNALPDACSDNSSPDASCSPTRDSIPTLAMIFADIREGLDYLRQQPGVLSIGITYACMMAGVISANVLVVALAHDLLGTGAKGYGYIQAGWAVGAVAGGLLAGTLARRRPFVVLVLALGTLAVGHAVFPFVRLLAVAVAMNAVFGVCRALGGVITQSSIMTTVPRRLMGRTQSAFSVIATMLQVLMSFTLGWFAQHVALSAAFVLLGLIYSGGVVAALRARALSQAAPHSPAAPVAG